MSQTKKIMKKTYILLVIIMLSVTVFGQNTKMRTRVLTSLTNVEVEQYLKRNDVIFIPVGATEVHGGFPLDCEYVGPLALAIKMAEKADGLVFPNLSYFYPGATQIGRGTVQTSAVEGAEYLKTIARSLLRQGFKTQIYITGHGPSYGFMEPFLFDFLDETKVPILYINQMNLMMMSGKGMDMKSFDKMIYGSYSIVGRLDDMPLSFDGIDLPKDFKPTGEMGTPTAAEKLLNLNSTQAVQWYYNSPYDHGGVPKSITAEERDQWAKEGVEVIDKIIKDIDVNAIVSNLKEHQKYIQETVKKYGDLLKF
jgi:creatinine amidohydrolase